MSILMENSIVLKGDICVDNTEFVGLFPRGHVSILAGEPGIGKTWFMLDFARGLVSGQFVSGNFASHVKAGRALIFAGETGVKLLGARMSALGECLGVENMRVVSLHVCMCNNVNVMINTAVGRKNITEAVREFKPDVVFFDTMISFMSDGKDESSQVDMFDTLRGLTFIAAENNCAIVVMHHFRKRQQGSTDKRTMDDVIGTSAFTRLASLVVGIYRQGETRYVKCLKSWWREFSTFAFTIKSVGDKVVVMRDYTMTDTGREMSRVVSSVARVVYKEYEDGNDFSLIDVCSLCDVSRPSASEAVALLLRKGYAVEVAKVGNTRKYRIIPQSSDNGGEKA